MISTVRAILPPSLRPLLEDLLAVAKLVVPSKSAISRWRFIIDANYMLMQREALQHMLREGGVLCYMMADSSMQHGRDFEHVVLQVIAVKNLLELYTYANQLVDIWSTRIVHGMSTIKL